jgi:hypothetical protein
LSAALLYFFSVMHPSRQILNDPSFVRMILAKRGCHGGFAAMIRPLLLPMTKAKFCPHVIQALLLPTTKAKFCPHVIQALILPTANQSSDDF